MKERLQATALKKRTKRNMISSGYWFAFCPPRFHIKMVKLSHRLSVLSSVFQADARQMWQIGFEKCFSTLCHLDKTRLFLNLFVSNISQMRFKY
jgi:hypothetical protein